VSRPLRIPDDFLLGTASAAHQVEGGLWNDWVRMETEEPWRIKGRDSAALAIDHYHRYHDDLVMLAGMGHTAQRFSLEWARIEPEEGSFDTDALRHYRDVVSTSRDLGMEPVVTLHHFTLPVWLADRGGLLAPETPRLFARYAAVCAQALGPQVRWWITLNEPNVLAALAYAGGRWPPHQRSLLATRRAGIALLRMHAGAAAAVRRSVARRDGTALISIAHQERPLRGGPQGMVSRGAAAVCDAVFNRWFLRSCVRGRALAPGGGMPVPGLRGSLDYIGVNYYCEERVRFDLRAVSNLFVAPAPDPALPRSSVGWSIEPDGLRRALLALAREFRLPLLITENGVADEEDELRPAFLTAHLRAAIQARQQGADLRGYLHWTGFDNFEWLEGYGAKFGLVAVDRTSLARRPKPSAGLYAEICRTRVIPEVVPGTDELSATA
jgi:beta-glucosidase